VAATAAGGKTCHQKGQVGKRVVGSEMPLPFDADNAISAKEPRFIPTPLA